MPTRNSKPPLFVFLCVLNSSAYFNCDNLMNDVSIIFFSGSGAEEVHYLEEDLTRAERKIESLKQEVSRLQLKNSDVSISSTFYHPN